MSVKLSKLNKLEEKRSVTINFGDDSLTIVYNRSKYTPKFEREIKEMMDANLPAGSLAKMVFALVLDWDLLDDRFRLLYKNKDTQKFEVDVPEDKRASDEPKVQYQNKAGKWAEEVPEDDRATDAVPLTWEVFDSLLSVDALTTLVEKLAEDNRPNVKQSDFTSDT